MASTFRCTLVTPEKQIFEVDATYVSVPAFDGQVGFQAGRAPLLAKLGYGLLRVEQADGQKLEYLVGDGFAQMKDDALSILASEVKPASEISAQDAKATLAEALAVRAVDEQAVARRDRQVARARAMVAISA